MWHLQLDANNSRERRLQQVIGDNLRAVATSVSGSSQTGRLVPASEIEAAVIAQVRKVLQTPEVMAQAIREVQALDPEADAQQVIMTLQSIEPVWDELFPAEQVRIVQLLVDRVTVSPTGIRVDMKTAGMRELIQSVIAEPDSRKAA